MGIYLLTSVDEQGKIQNKYVDSLQFTPTEYPMVSTTRRFENICEKVVYLLSKSKDDYEFWQGLNIPSYAEFVSLKLRNIDNKNTFIDLIDQNGNVYENMFHFSFWQISGVTTTQEAWDNEQKFYTSPSPFFILTTFLLQNFIVTDYSFAGVEPLAYYTKAVTDEKLQVIEDKFNNYYDETYINVELKKIDDKLILLSNAIGSSNNITLLSDNVVSLLTVINTLSEKIDTLVSSDSTIEQNSNTKIDDTQFSELKSLFQGIAKVFMGVK